MSQHIVRVHPVEYGEPNLHKVLMEREFETEEDAKRWIRLYNGPLIDDEDVAIYRGRVNDYTGELE